MPITTPGIYTEQLSDPEHFPHVLAHLFIPALEEAGLAAITPSTVGTELIHAEIIRNLEQADFVLCDLSGLNPNVLFELGIRTSLDRPVILVKDDLTERIPFDLSAINTLTYDSSLTPWSLVIEKPRLVGHIRSVITSGSTGNPMWRYFGLTKRAKPSEAGENPLEAKVDLLISELSKPQQPTVVINQTVRETTTFEDENTPASESRSRSVTSLSSLLMPELQKIAQVMGIEGAGRMRKGQLIEAIEAQQKRRHS